MTRVPITSPLAVLTTRTTQEHIMTTHSTTDLKPGDIVQHPEKGIGLVHRRFARNDVGAVYADKDRDGITSYTNDLTGWKRVETVRQGHVQVRVDDLDLSEWLTDEQPHYTDDELAVIRAAKAWSAQRAESTPPADEQNATVADESPAMTGKTGDEQPDEPEIVGDGCECWVTPEHMWTTHYGAVEPGSQVEYNSRCPKHGEKPTSATVTLFCPDCGGAENVTVVMLGKQSNGERWFDLREFHAHTCPPVQPDEPTEFGARVTVTLPDGTREKWCRLGKHHPAPWLGETYEVPGEAWSLLCGRGTVTIGWDE